DKHEYRESDPFPSVHALHTSNLQKCWNDKSGYNILRLYPRYDPVRKLQVAGNSVSSGSGQQSLWKQT
ncbi:MAG: hypothetical protein C4293_04500, partial [Nitrospiraceae bacterium]